MGAYPIALTAEKAGRAGMGTLNLTVVAPGVLPMVTVDATHARAIVGGGSNGAFVVRIPTAGSADLRVSLSLTGGAKNGTDFAQLGDLHRTEGGRTWRFIRVRPQGDLDGAPSKTVALTVIPGPGYVPPASRSTAPSSCKNT